MLLQSSEYKEKEKDVRSKIKIMLAQWLKKIFFGISRPQKSASVLHITSISNFVYLTTFLTSLQFKIRRIL